MSLRGRPDTTYRHYIFGFRGEKDADRRADQTRAASVWMRRGDAAVLAQDPNVTWIDSAVPGAGDKQLQLGEATGWNYTRHRFNDTYAEWWFGNGSGVRVAVIGDGVECELVDIPCGVGASVIGGNPDIDGGSSHETAAASIIAAEVGNGTGIRGAAPNATIHSILAYDGIEITCLNSAEAIQVAADPGGPIRAHVINYSYGGYGGCPSRDSVIYGNYQVLVVAGAGNHAIGTVMNPASNPYTVAVSAIESDNKIWYDGTNDGSNYGREITIAVAGKNVPALRYWGAVEDRTGTSFAAPQVTGAIALIIGRKLYTEGCVPDRADVLLALTSSAFPPEPPFVTDWYGAGILDAAAAVDSAVAQDEIVCLDPGW